MKKIIMIVFILIVIGAFGTLYYFQVYMGEKNVTERYFEKKGYSCVGNNCTKKDKNVKYSYDIKTKDLYISKDKYVLVVGEKYPVLRFKTGNKVCNYEIEYYKVGNHVNDEYTYENDCIDYIDEVNVYIDEYKKIVNDIK